MCGITGWYLQSGAELPPAVLNRLSDSISHRGPDDKGEFRAPSAGLALAQRRLSIIELSQAGHQPMIHDATGDVLIFNGEIYNYSELRTELERQGCWFRSSSDTEVLLQGLVVWGFQSCLNRLRGMYVFALWRPNERVLHIARDPMGIKPLYYTTPPDGQGFVFSSEIKSFIHLPGFSRQIDRRALGQFLEFGYTFDAERTIFTGVHKLPPGHHLTVREGIVGQPISFFNPVLNLDDSRTSYDWQEDLNTTLHNVITEHLNADVPVGLLLSGGLDSSLLAAIAAHAMPLRTLCMGFADSAVDERPYAREVANHIGSEHEEVLIAPDEFQPLLQRSAYDFDDLFADWGTITTKLLYQKCRERGIKVVIVGEGADELFGGYDIFRHSFSCLPMEVWLVQLYRRYCGRRYGRYFVVFRRKMRRYLAATGGDRFAAIRLFESRDQLPNNYVMKVDKASMSVGVEARTPFLDQRVAEIAYQIPSRHLLSSRNEKEVLRRLADRYGLLPKRTLSRGKFGASIAASWMETSPSLRRYAHDLILTHGGWTEILGLDGAMRAYFLDGRTGYPFPRSISVFRNLAWRLLALELWSRAYGITATDG